MHSIAEARAVNAAPDSSVGPNIPPALHDGLSTALNEKFGILQRSPLYQAAGVDGTTVLLLRNSAGDPCAVLLYSAPCSADMVKRTILRARMAKGALGPLVGRPILEALDEGCEASISYAVLPYCKPLAISGPVWWAQRSLLRGPLFVWLRSMTESTLQDIATEARDSDFGIRLRHMRDLPDASEALHAASRQSLSRLQSGRWVPKHVLMHGDLWKGNVLIGPKGNSLAHRGWRYRFVIIDWPGAELKGYALFDLVRLAKSMSLSEKHFGHEVKFHCKMLGCELQDARGYLLTALGHIAMNLERFPMNRFVKMADTCLSALDHAIGNN